MFRRTDPQATFGSLRVLLSLEKNAGLEKNHWAGVLSDIAAQHPGGLFEQVGPPVTGASA